MSVTALPAQSDGIRTRRTTLDRSGRASALVAGVSFAWDPQVPMAGPYLMIVVSRKDSALVQPAPSICVSAASARRRGAAPYYRPRLTLS